MTLFSNEKQQLRLPDADLEYIPDFLTKTVADMYYKLLLHDTNWRHDDITVFGKTYKQPRLTALFGESDQSYSYSNITMYPEPFTETLERLKQKVENQCSSTFNTVLLNLYRSGNDSNSWHADNEKELGINPTIASLSLGETRPFHFKHRKDKEHRYKINLKHGSLLIMKGAMQHHWLHQIAKTKRRVNPRINLTFRYLID
jgi:alkylated DNA repair dioxygenase AlkB